MKLRHYVMILLVLLFIGQTIYCYPMLPDVMATHFDGDGRPDGSMEKSSFVVLDFVILGVMAFEFLCLPWLIEKMPDSLINLPNKSYWLAPERRQYAFEIFRTYFQWLSVGLLMFLAIVNQLVFRANITRTNLDSSLWLVLGAFFVFDIIWLVKFIMAFRKTS